ncbi:NADP-specific glutamate dehydrogenase [Candidatus Avelusimicrobium caledoniensis]|uniref:NADP-specific glutamate dehydrogenase n=1 Tax=Candidatus Avelusimicrobium caledoniensis TaxID=3416220 RepID=UPI003D1298FC
MDIHAYTADFLEAQEKKDPGQKVFLQAVKEVVSTLHPVLEQNPVYIKEKILERLVEPERIISFRVPWQDDKGEIHVNRGYRVQFNSAIGPYKGGIRFHTSVTQDSLKFLAFEQTFKNSLTTLPLGGGKGGSDFDARGKSDGEVMRFCHSFMNELYRHIGYHTDVPAGDLGCGAREIGYMYGQYKKLTDVFTGTFTGKKPNWGGSLLRPEATGYGVAYFTQNMLATKNDSVKGKTCIVSGTGNVGVHAIEKLTELGGKVVGFMDYDGSVYDKDGVDAEKLAFLKDLVFVRRGSLKEYVKKFPKAEFRPGKKTWDIPCNIACPTACENELHGDDAKTLLKNGCKCVCEGSNMPCTPEAIEAFQAAGILYSPGKASNAGGVAVSGLEMTQNSMRLYWTREEVDQYLHRIMNSIHNSCLEAAEMYGMKGNYMAGANIAGFKKVADSMLDQGLV